MSTRPLDLSSRPVLGLTILLAAAVMTACGGGPTATGPSCSNSNGLGGFTVHISDVNGNGVITGPAAGGQAWGTFASALSGSPLQGCTSSFGSASDFLSTPLSVTYGDSPALWSGAFKAWCVDPSIAPAGFDWSTDLYVGDPINQNGGGPLNEIGSCSLASADSFFELTGSVPSTLTVPGTGLTTTHGLPRLELSSIKANGVLSYTQALSVATNGTSATFQFPPNSSGSSLSTGLYGYVLQNQSSPGVYTDVGGDALAIGSATTLTAPYGVDAINKSVFTEVCTGGTDVDLPASPFSSPILPPPTCNSSTFSSILPLVTLVNSAELNYSGSSFTVGTQPTAVKAYHNGFTTTGTPGTGVYTRTTQPTLALVANTGSNTVSIVSLLPATGVTATITVGTQPVAILIDSTGTYAYIANMGSGTVSQINLSTHAVVGTATVGSTPTSLAMDPSATAFWVGGLNYISKVTISSLAVATTYPITGQVTSLSVSSGQNSYVYTSVNGTTFTGAHAELSSGKPHTDYQVGLGAEVEKLSSSSGTLPTWLNIGGPLVSASYGNRYIVEGTPTGFAVLDLVVNKVMMQGTTSAPIVGIAVDAQQGTAYATETNSNTLLSIPLPPVQLD